jgi:hypothetical protein
MPVSAFNKFNSFVEAVAEKAHNLGSDQLKIMLTATAPNVATQTKYADISGTELANGNGYTTGGAVATITSSAQTAGTYKLILADVLFTAGPASMGPFRYPVLYNNTDTTTPKGLIGYWDNGANVTLNNTETFTVDFDPVTGVLQLV